MSKQEILDFVVRNTTSGLFLYLVGDHRDVGKNREHFSVDFLQYTDNEFSADNLGFTDGSLGFFILVVEIESTNGTSGKQSAANENISLSAIHDLNF